MRYTEIINEVDRPRLLSRLGHKIGAKIGLNRSTGSVESQNKYKKLWSAFTHWMGSADLTFGKITGRDVQLKFEDDDIMQAALAEQSITDSTVLKQTDAKNLIWTYTVLSQGRAPVPSPAPLPPAPTPSPKKKTIRPVLYDYRTVIDYLNTTMTPTQSARILVGLGAIRTPKKPLKFRADEQDIIDRINLFTAKQRDFVIRNLSKKYLSSTTESVEYKLREDYQTVLSET